MSGKQPHQLNTGITGTSNHTNLDHALLPFTKPGQFGRIVHHPFNLLETPAKRPDFTGIDFRATLRKEPYTLNATAKDVLYVVRNSLIVRSGQCFLP